jgi:Flp pilus assembly protein TadG/formylmethanofuran dehydrogenase subunit C
MTRRRTANAHGLTLVYTICAMMALLALTSLAVDLARVQLCKTELQQAADAAARYAVHGIADGTYRSKAQAAAAENSCDGSPVTLLTQDVELGTWSGGTFTPGGSSPNAIRITARRAASRGNAIPLAFGRIVGVNTVDAAAVAVATISSSPSNYGFVGLDSITMSGNAQVDSYLSSQGAYSSATRRQNGHIATRGSISLSGNVRIYGNAYYKAGMFKSGNAAVVSPGQAQVLSGDLSYPPPTLPASYVNLGNLTGSGNGSIVLNSGNYYVNNISTSGNYTIRINGQVRLYVAGNVSLSGNVSTLGNVPGNFVINVMNSGNVALSGNSNLYADVYAPNGAVSVSGNGDLFGRIVSKSLSISGNGKFHYDEDLGPASTASDAVVSMVQ